MGEPSIDSLHDPYEDQLSAARYKAERDQLRQRVDALEEWSSEIDDMYRHVFNELVDETKKSKRLGKLVWRLQNRLARAHRRERALRKGMREWRDKVMGAPVRTVSAYDLLPEEELQTLRWVREHGGLDVVATHAELFQQLRGERDELRELARDYEKRLMPEGMEWLLEVWPKWSNGEYCKFGDWWVSDKYGEPKPKQFRKLSIYTPELLREWKQDDGDHFGYEWDFVRPADPKHRPDKAEPPAPKVLDADGVEINVGDTVYFVDARTFDPEYNEYVVTDIRTKPGLTPIEVKNSHNGYNYGYSEDFTHRAPVLAADGRPLREGETVWDTKGNGPYNIQKIEDDGIVRIDGNDLDYFGSDFVHERPESWERIEEDLGDEMAKQQCGPISPELACRLAGEFVRRCRALAEREGGE